MLRGLCNAGVATAICAVGMASLAVGPTAEAAVTQPAVPAVTQPSTGCAGSSAEPEEAVDPTSGRQYIVWEGCGGVGFAYRSPGQSFATPVALPHSKGGGAYSWDGAVAVAPNGTVFVTFEVTVGARTYPVVASSTNGGVSFSQVTDDNAVPKNDWGDRPNLAIGADSKTVYLSWDYGPSASLVNVVCSPIGSCAFTTGDLNIVVQVSTDGGNTFGNRIPVTPGYPFSGSDIGPLLVEPGGRVDCLYQGYQVTNPVIGALAPGNVYFTSSSDQGKTWTAPVEVGETAGTMSLTEWWDEPAVSLDAGGNLYAVWDTQSANSDVGWVSYSTDHGATWSAPLAASTDASTAPHLMNVLGLGAGRADVVWLSSSDPRGYALFERPLSTTRGWLGPPSILSTAFGKSTISPGDTVGLARADATHLAISWGGTTTSSPNRSQISAGTFPDGAS